MSNYTLLEGRLPLLLSMPHTGTDIPPEIIGGMTAAAHSLIDTDWHVDRLYQPAQALGVYWLQPQYSRYVIDLNRPPDDASLYPGQHSTGLCPSTTFAADGLYKEEAPNAKEIERRRQRYWQPYHDALESTLATMLDRFGEVVLFEAHSIASVVPQLFEGQLKDFNLGTYEDRSCDGNLTEVLSAVLQAQSQYTAVVNGRFKGGYITRHYGNPTRGIHAVQLELSQATYLNEAAIGEYAEDKARQVQPLLLQLLQSALDWLAKREKKQ